jgi:hypothetical protein
MIEGNEIVTRQDLVLLGFGALGGMVRSASLKTTWKEGIRVVFIGSATSFGFGSLTPVMLKPFIGDIPADLQGTVGFIASAAFLVGLIAVTIVERLIAGKK